MIDYHLIKIKVVLFYPTFAKLNIESVNLQNSLPI